MKFSRYFLFVFLILFYINFTYAQGYYADIEIDVENDGTVSIDGTTDYEEFKNVTNSQMYTSKNGEVWTLNITTTQVFDTYIYELSLPKYAKINYMKTTPHFRIEDENSRIKLIGTGENKPFMLVVQYKIDFRDTLFSQENVIWISVGSAILAFIIIGFLIFKFNKTLNHKLHILSRKEKEKVEDKPKYDFSILPQRQQQIIKILQKKGKITQKQLEEEMNIPKSSVSRNVQTLVIKRIIEKEQAGQSNYIFLRED